MWSLAIELEPELFTNATAIATAKSSKVSFAGVFNLDPVIFVAARDFDVSVIDFGHPEALQPGWNPDLYFAAILSLSGVPFSEPDDSMPYYLYDAMAFAQANDIATLVGTPEYQCAASAFIGF